MVQHGPKCLEGPIVGSTQWWQELGEQDDPILLSFEAKTRRKGKRVTPPVRTELVERVRREIADGTYETPEKWEAALDRLFEKL